MNSENKIERLVDAVGAMDSVIAWIEEIESSVLEQNKDLIKEARIAAKRAFHKLNTIKTIETEHTESEEEDNCMWSCVCGLLVDGQLHCPSCNSCCPWGCGIDHEEQEKQENYNFNFDEGDIP